MSLLFGNLTQDFIEFQTVAAYAADPNNATAQAQLPLAQASFRHTAALDASYLVYIGPLPTPIAEPCSRSPSLLPYRCWNVHMYLYLHVHLGLHWRSQRQTSS